MERIEELPSNFECSQVNPQPKLRRKNSFIGLSKQRQQARDQRNYSILTQNHDTNSAFVADHWTRLLLDNSSSHRYEHSKKKQTPKRVSNNFVPTKIARAKRISDRTLEPKFYPQLTKLIATSPYLNDNDFIGLQKNPEEPLPGEVLNTCYQEIMSYEADYKSKPDQYKQAKVNMEHWINIPKATIDQRLEKPYYAEIFEQYKKQKEMEEQIKNEEENKTRISKEIRRARSAGNSPNIRNYPQSFSSSVRTNALSVSPSSPTMLNDTTDTAGMHAFDTTCESEDNNIDRHQQQQQLHVNGTSSPTKYIDKYAFKHHHKSSSQLLEDLHRKQSSRSNLYFEYDSSVDQHSQSQEQQQDTKHTENTDQLPPLTEYTSTDVVTCLVNMLSIQLERDSKVKTKFTETLKANQQIAFENVKYGASSKLLLQRHLENSQSQNNTQLRPQTASATMTHSKHTNSLHNAQFKQSLTTIVNQSMSSETLVTGTGIQSINKLPGSMVIPSVSTPVYEWKSRPTSAGKFGGIARASHPVETLTVTNLRPKSATAITKAIEKSKLQSNASTAGIYQISTKVSKIRPVVVQKHPAELWPDVNKL